MYYSFFQVISKDKILSEIHDDDVILMQKIAQLEVQLRKKSSQPAATQTDEPVFLLAKSTPPPYKPPPPVLNQRDRQKEKSFGNFDAPTENNWLTNTELHPRSYLSPLPSHESRIHSTPRNPKSENKLIWNSQVVHLVFPMLFLFPYFICTLFKYRNYLMKCAK